MERTKKIIRDPLIIGIIIGSMMMFVALIVFGLVKPASIELDLNGVESIFKLFFAAFTGAIIGFERENKNRPAGLRTHALVCIGAAIVMIIPGELIATGKVLATMDVTRLGAQVISGIGFLGAGTIIRDKGNIKGLTTAASLWVVGIIGLSIGAGSYITSLAATMIVIILLKVFGTFEHRNMMKKRAIELLITTHDGPRQINAINQVIDKYQLYMRKMEVHINEKKEDIIYISIIVVAASIIDFSEFFGEIRDLDCIIDIEHMTNKKKKKIKK